MLCRVKAGASQHVTEPRCSLASLWRTFFGSLVSSPLVVLLLLRDFDYFDRDIFLFSFFRRVHP
jgi:hypothetical protein